MNILYNLTYDIFSTHILTSFNYIKFQFYFNLFLSRYFNHFMSLNFYQITIEAAIQIYRKLLKSYQGIYFFHS